MPYFHFIFQIVFLSSIIRNFYVLMLVQKKWNLKNISMYQKEDLFKFHKLSIVDQTKIQETILYGANSGDWCFWQTSDGGLFLSLRVGDRIVTNSSAAVGWTPTVASNSAFVKPAFTATANPWEYDNYTFIWATHLANIILIYTEIGDWYRNLHNFRWIFSTHVYTKNFVCLCADNKFHKDPIWEPWESCL